MKPTRFEITLLAVGGLTALLLATDVWPGLRGPESWRWGRRLLATPWGLLGVVAVFAGQVLVAAQIRRTWGVGRRPLRALWLATAVALAFGQMVVLTATEPGGLANLARRVIDPSFTSYHTIARDVDDPQDFLRRYHRLQHGFPVHGPSQPPGRVLFYRAVNEWASEPGRTAALLALGDRLGGVPAGLPGTTDGQRAGAVAAGFLLLGIGALCLVPLVPLAGGRCEPGTVAAVVLLFGTVPSYLLFTPLTDPLILLLTLVAAALTVESMRYATRPWAFAATFGGGVAAGASVFVSFTSLAALAAWAVAGFGMAALARRRGDPFPPPRRIALLFAAALGGFAVVPGIVAAAGMDWVAVFRECTRHAEIVQRGIHGRSTWPWILWNPVDFALFLGPALTLAWIARTAAEVRALRGDGREPTGRPLELPFGVALAVALLALDLTGRILGETGRIWLFLMPFAALAAAAARGGLPFRAAVVLALAQLPVLLAMRGTLNVPG